MLHAPQENIARALVVLCCVAVASCAEESGRTADARRDGPVDGRATDARLDGALRERGPSDGARDGRAEGKPLSDGKPGDGSSTSKVWATGYYAGWMQSHLPPSKIDYSALSHVIHFALIVKANGTLDDQGNGVTTTNAQAAVQAAHAAGKKILISVGGWSSSSGFQGATSTANRAAFIASLVNLMSARGYDGIDVDWEPLSASDATQYVAFITALRTALTQKKPGLLLMAAVGWQPSIIAQVSSQLDQINVMTYDMSGAWPGWVTWHNSPIYTGGCKFQSTGQPVPCADSTIQQYIQAGVPTKKLGIGIDFYGYVWSGGSGTTTGGVTAPCQSYSSDPTVTSNVPYYQIMSSYFQASYAKWDTGAQAAYLAIDASGSTNDKFVSYDNETTVAAKVKYAKTKGLGGVFVWELGGGFRPTQPVGQQDVLLQALKQANP